MKGYTGNVNNVIRLVSQTLGNNKHAIKQQKDDKFQPLCLILDMVT